ncbi:MAG: GTPase ObgE [Peptoniphilaceae bacterium]|nr:GTPase ObgE [Peptoniphilaceae bacterium]MDY6085252.1 GTPase ObgE [Peptoniphilaceae bacterium]
MFIDQASIEVHAGHGGDGAISWRREKYVPDGGPDGGDGGRGGSVILRADEGVRTLLDFQFHPIYKAESGEPGRGQKQFGKAGEDLVLRVPVGTIVREKNSGLPVADLRHHGQEFVVAKGGLGGKGNVHFKSSTRQAPRFAKPGGSGQSIAITLEVKLLADVGLVGMPNVGKSTLLSILTNAKPKIANYHFTTLDPNLGVVDLGEGQTYIVADIPGLIEGASEGAGLGHDFLRHIERTRLLAHVLDMSGSEGRDPLEDFDRIQQELTAYNPKLAERVKIVVANKMDLPGAAEHLAAFRSALRERGIVLRTPEEQQDADPWGEDEAMLLVTTSAATSAGVKPLRYLLGAALEGIEKTDLTFDEDLVPLERFYRRNASVRVYREGKTIYVEGEPVKNLSKKLIITDGASVQFFERSLEQMGVMDRVRDLHPDEDDVINIEGFEFDWL